MQSEYVIDARSGIRVQEAGMEVQEAALGVRKADLGVRDAAFYYLYIN